MAENSTPTPLAIRASDETKAAYNEGARDYKNSGDFLEYLINLHKAKEAGKQSDLLNSAIDATKGYTDKLMGIFSAVANQIAQQAEQAKEKLENDAEKSKQLLNIAASENERLKNEILVLQAALTDMKKALESEKTYHDLADSQSERVRLQQADINDLKAKIAEQERAVSQAKEERAELDRLQRENSLQAIQIRDMEADKEKALAELRAEYVGREALAEQTHAQAIAELQEKHTQAIIELFKAKQGEAPTKQDKPAAKRGRKPKNVTADQIAEDAAPIDEQVSILEQPE